MNRRAAAPLTSVMLRPLAIAATAVFAAAQQPPKLTLLLNDPFGQPVARATGELQCDPECELPALRGAAATPPTRLTGTSDQRGILRFPASDAPRAGAVFVTTAHGLGAVVPRLLPGDVPRVVLQPMAEITTAGASEPLVVWAALRTPDGERIALGPLRGERVRLPAGSYECWAKSHGGWLWQRIELASGQSHVLRFDGQAQRLRRARGATVHPSGWPGIELLGPGTGECTLLGGAVAAPLVARLPETGRVLAESALPGPTSRDPIDWPPLEPDVGVAELAIADAPAGTTVFSLRGTDGASWRLLGVASVRDGGAFVLPRGGGGDDWLLAVAEGHAPLAVPWSDLAAGKKLALVRGAPLVVLCTTDAGEPAVDLVLDFVPETGDVARVVARSDGRGRARFGPLQAPGVLRISDARFANQEIPVATIPGDGLTVTVSTGARLLGKAVLPDGAPIADAVVTLRDPRGRLRPASRSVTTGPDGEFAFAGLPPDVDLVLFATTVKDGRTWSGRLSRARASSELVVITVKSEDPELEPGSGR